MKKKLCFTLMSVFLVANMAIETAAQVAPYNRDAVYDGISQTSQYINSFDGTQLAVTVIRPTLKGTVVSEPLPVIMYQDRNLMGDFLSNTVRFFTDRGYVFVLQDRRGTGASFGYETGFLDENVVKDAVATIEWAGAQPFCNKKVVALGCSNQGGWQYVVAAKAPKYLVAIAPACSSPQFFDHGVSMNGINIYQVNEKPYTGKIQTAPAAMPAGMPRRMPPPVDADIDSSLLKKAIAEHAGGAPMLGQYWLNMPRDGYNEYARNRPAIDNIAITYADAIKKSGIAVLQLMGWFDACVAGGIEGQRAWNGQVIFGPWVHGNGTPRGASFTNGTLNLNAEMLRWFDFYAKGIKNGAQQGITYYTINAPAGNEWNETPVWPPKEAVKTAFFMTENGLSTTKPGVGGEEIVYNQQDVLWFGGKNRYSPLNRWWDGDMNETDSKSLTHTSESLSKAIEVTGTPVAKLWISADARDVNVFAVLEDISPDGKSTYVSDGRLRASWRKLHIPEWAESDQSYHRGFSEDIAPLTPGEPVEMVFDFFPLSYIFKEGHKIRISIVTSLGEAYQLPPMAEGKTVSLTLYRDELHPSAVYLPVIEGSNNNTTDNPYAPSTATNGDRLIPYGTALDPQAQIRESQQLAKSLNSTASPQWRTTGDQRRTYKFPGTGVEIPYRIYVPTKWDGKSELPLVLFLHGGGSDENIYLDANDKQLLKLAEQHGYLLVSPLGYSRTGAYGTSLRLPAVFGKPEEAAKIMASVTNEKERELELSEKDVINVLEIILDEYTVDRSRIYLAGHSMGSGGTWYLGAKYNEYWSAIAPTSGPFVEKDMYPWDRIRNMPIFMTEGTGATPSVEGSRLMSSWMKEQGFKLEYMEVDADHGGMVPLVLPSIFDFFDRHTK